MKYLTIAIPCKGSVQARFNICLFQAVNQIYGLTGYKPLIRFLVGKSNIVHARSILLTEWYDKASEEDLFLFIDSDQIFSIDDIVASIKQEGDVISGIYVNGAGFPTCYPLDLHLFKQGKDNRLLYSGCGFMLIRKEIVRKIVEEMKKEGPTRYAISRDGSVESSIIPFFQPKLLEQSEMSENETPKGDWLGEDYSFCWRVRQAGGRLTAMFSKTLGHEIPQVSMLPSGYFPQSSNEVNEKSIVYFCGHSKCKFSPEIKSLGGSEKAVVEISRAWAKIGYKVQVYGNVWPGIYEDVEYIDSRDFDIYKQYNILVLWRSFGLMTLDLVNAKHIWLDLHDYPQIELFNQDILEKKKVKICVKSHFQRNLLSFLPDSFFFIQPNGIEVELLEKRRPVINKKEEMRFIWTSSYDRGLHVFLEKGWPLVRKKFPTATLHIYYGMDLCSEDLQSKLKNSFEKTKGDGVTEYGRCDMEQICKEKWKSSYHIYVSEFPEVDCLSIRESVYANCIPICPSHSVFVERPALHVGQGYERSVYNTEIIWDQVLSLLERLESDKEAKEKVVVFLSEQLKKQALDISWMDVANKWLETLL